MAWRRRDDMGVWRVFANRFDQGSWQPAPTLLTTNGNDDAEYLQIAGDSSGCAATWVQYDGINDDLVFFAHFDGTSWHPPVSVYQQTGNARDPVIAANSQPS